MINQTWKNHQQGHQHQASGSDACLESASAQREVSHAPASIIGMSSQSNQNVVIVNVSGLIMNVLLSNAVSPGGCLVGGVHGEGV